MNFQGIEEDQEIQNIECLKVRTIALEEALKLSTKIMRDLLKGNNAKEVRYRQLTNETIITNYDLLGVKIYED
jgi:hypothetical protein